MLRILSLLAISGAAGTLARYGLAAAVLKWRGPGFPWGTLAVNALGCLFFGYFSTLADERGAISPETRLLLTTGFLGAFTTFSTFAWETAQLGRAQQPLHAFLNVAAQVLIGLALAMAGAMAARKI
ncbi:MAG: CrcB [Planctomycetota bacterium]|nr:MAG: CrcB [Planctomycetota bacterium]